MNNDFLGFKNAKDKAIGITIFVGLPILVLVIFIIAFTKKTKLDLCNPAYYTCDPPTSITSPTSTTISCGASHIIPDYNLADSSSTINGYKIAGIVLILLTLTISVLWSIFGKTFVNGNHVKNFRIATIWANWGNTTNIEKNKHLLYFWVMLVGISILAIITFVYLNKSSPNDKHIAFSVSFIALLINIIVPLYSVSDNKLAKGANAILIAILLVFTINTIVFHITQEKNLNEGKITYAINESTVNTMAPMMIIIGLVNLIIGVAFVYINLINSEKPVVPKLIFGITQVISGILLIAATAYFYSYTVKCNDSPVYCKLEFKRVDSSSGTEVCVPYSNMSMSHTSSVKMGSVIGGLMAINQVIGFISILMIVPTPP
jgi:hypothetical protein